MKKTEHDAARIEELLCQSLETEIGGIDLHTLALIGPPGPDSNASR